MTKLDEVSEMVGKLFAQNNDAPQISQCSINCGRDLTGNPALRGDTGYWINGNIAGRRLSLAVSPAKTLLVGEGDDGVDLSNAAYARTRFSANWLTNPRMPPFRHSGGANYLFVDGHVAWLRPDEIEHFGGRPNPFSLK